LHLQSSLSIFTPLLRIFTKQPIIMLREFLTLFVETIPTQYYLHFEKDRKHFIFRPTLRNDSAPFFEIFVENNELIIKGDVDESLGHQAKEKVNEILNNRIFDQF